jgi:hypothetical protein
MFDEAMLNAVSVFIGILLEIAKMRDLQSCYPTSPTLVARQALRMIDNSRKTGTNRSMQRHI